MRNGWARIAAWVPPLRRVAARLGPAGALLLAACSTQDLYLVPTAALGPQPTIEQPSAPLPSAASADALAAQRAATGQPVWIRRSAIEPGSRLAVSSPSAPSGGGPELSRVRARAYSPGVTAGATLTWVGTAVSLLGSGLFLAGRVRGDNGLFLAGAFTALAAEPVMWAGIVYWFAGTLRPAQEVAAPAR